MARVRRTTATLISTPRRTTKRMSAQTLIARRMSTFHVNSDEAESLLGERKTSKIQDVGSNTALFTFFLIVKAYVGAGIMGMPNAFYKLRFSRLSFVLSRVVLIGIAFFFFLCLISLACFCFCLCLRFCCLLVHTCLFVVDSSKFQRRTLNTAAS